MRSTKIFRICPEGMMIISIDISNLSYNNTGFYVDYWDPGNTKNILLNEDIRQWMTCADNLHENSSF